MKSPTGFLTAALIIPLLLASCAPRELEELNREELFNLQIGKMDNQIDLFQVGGVMAGAKNRIYMRDGLFYLANGNSAKIMELSSYGDLIFLLYNSIENPPPTSFNTEQTTERIESADQTEGEELSSTRRAVAYPLQRIGELVASDREIKQNHGERFAPIGNQYWIRSSKPTALWMDDSTIW